MSTARTALALIAVLSLIALATQPRPAFAQKVVRGTMCPVGEVKKCVIIPVPQCVCVPKSTGKSVQRNRASKKPKPAN